MQAWIRMEIPHVICDNIGTTFLDAVTQGMSIGFAIAFVALVVAGIVYVWQWSGGHR